MQHGNGVRFSGDGIVCLIHKVKSAVHFCLKVLDDDGFVDIKFFPLVRGGVGKRHVGQMLVHIVAALRIDFLYGKTAHDGHSDPVPYGFFHKNRFFATNLPGGGGKVNIFFSLVEEAVKEQVFKHVEVVNLDYHQGFCQFVLSDSDGAA